MSIDSVAGLRPEKSIFQDAAGHLWIVESVFDRPSVTLRKIHPPPVVTDNGEDIKMTGGVGCRNFTEMSRLHPE